MNVVRAAAVATALVFAALPARAGELYGIIGGDYFSSGLEGGDIGLGWQFDRFYSVELNVTAAGARAEDDYGDTYGVAVASVTVDGYGFLPLGRFSPVSLFATAGLGSAAVAASDGYETAGVSGATVRAGGGIDWRVSYRAHLRLTGRYQTVSIAGIAGSDATASAQVVLFF